MAKSLSRWPFNTGYWTVRNSDSLTMYTMAKYVQKALGDIYPHLPLAMRPPDRVEYGVQNGLFSLDNDGFITMKDDEAMSKLS